MKLRSTPFILCQSCFRLTFFFLLASFFSISVSHAQVANYTFAPSAGSYTPLAGATNIFPSGWDDNAAVSVPLGFTFTFNGIGYTSVFVHPNGYITFGSSTSGYLPISGGSAAAGVISAWGRDLQAQNTAPLGSVDYTSSGGVFTVQWSNTRRYNSTTINAERFEMQIKLIQATSNIQLVYGTWSDAINAITANNGEVGLRGSSGTDFKNLSVLSGGSWAAPALGGVNTATVFYNESNVANKPALGQTYTFAPPPPCPVPGDQPTALMLTPGVSTMGGSFTAASSAPSGYLVVRTLTNIAPSNPVNGTTYTAGQSALGGVIVSSSALTTFTATGLNPNTTYYFWIYSFNTGVCTGPTYLTTSPLTGSATTLSCAISGTRTVGPTGNYLTLTAAITDLNTNGLAGPVILELQSTYLSSAEPAFPIVIPALPCISAINNLVIRPQAGALALSITAATATSTITFDGGDFVTFDGRPGGVGSSQLTISNTSLTGNAITFINSATFNTLKFITVAGVTTSTTSGVIHFSTSVGLTTGNSNNTIDNSDIRDGLTTPTNLIYSSGTVTSFGSQNNNNTISNSLLHDWFNASSTTAGAAINVVGGSSDWTITNNSFYQSVARTFTMTTATDQGAIHINSVTFGFNFTITNNFIGGSAPMAGGAPWTYTGGATGTPTPRLIRFSTSVGMPFSNISNNTISNIAITTSSASTASGLITHLNGNVNIDNNTIGSQSTTGNITFTLASTSTAPFFLPISYGTGGSVSQINVTNNNLGGITVSTSSTGSVSFRVLYGQPVVSSKVLVSNNTIGGTVPNSIQQLTNNIFTAIMILNPTVGDVVTNNTIRNLTHNNIGVTGSLTGINVQASGGQHTITGNTVFNLTTNSTNVATNNASSITGITMTGSLIGGTNVSNNTVYNLTNTNTTVAGWINGLYFSTALAPQTTTISRNFVHSFNLASATGGMAGIFLPNAGTGSVYNNMVRLGIDGTGASVTNSLQINGIYKAATGSMGIYFNTVYIGGTGVASGAVNSYAFRRSSSGPADTLMNNIFFNARSNTSGTGKHYAIFLNAATAITSNYNDLLVTGTGGVLGLLGAVDHATLPAWQVAANQDWNSVSSDPMLVNPTGNSATVDLHIQTGVPTPVEQAGYNIPLVTTDYDLQSRAALTPVDIGADAGNFLLMDLTAPAIYYTPLAPTCATGDRTIAGVNITDATGIPLVGSLIPRIYYRKNAGTYFSQPGVYVSGTATNSFWDFTIVAADMGGLVATDVVSYYIIAQDNAMPPNIGSNPAGAIATDVNTVTTHPVSPNTYTVGATSLSGTYTVGVGGAYTTLTAAVAAYNTACLGGPVLFSLTDASYPSETFPITINSNSFASSTNTLTIKPAPGVSPNISGTPTGTLAMIILNGADYVTINGSNGSGVNTICPLSVASRDMTITNNSTSTLSAVIWLQSASALNGATNNQIINTNLVGSGNTQTLVGVGSGTTTISITSLGFGNNNNQIINNNISRTQYGIYSQGASLAAKNTGNAINQNLINTLSPNNVRIGGILLGFENNLLVSGNNVSGMALAGSPDIFGIALGLTAISTTAFTGNEVTNSTVSFNQIGSVVNTGTFSAVGISIANALSGTNTLYNNMISGVFANGTLGDFASGIFAGGGLGSTTKIYFNSVSMSGGGTGGSSPNYALAIGGVQPVVDVRNNILSSTGNNGTGINIAIGLAYSGTTGNYQNLTSDYNDLYASGVGSGVGVTGSLAAGVGIVRATLTDWRNETGRDLNSISVAPVFVSTADLHLTTSSGNQSIDGGGTPIAGITTDIDCQTRNATIPDIGADEFCAMPLITITETSGTTNNDGIVCSGATVTLTGIGEGTFAWSTGSSSNPIVVNPTTTTTYTLTVTDFSGCSGSTSVTITVVPLPVLTCPADMTVCADAAPFVLTGALPAGGTYAGTGVSNGTFSPSVAGVGIHPITYSYTDPTTNCSNTCTFLITVAALPVTTCPDDFSTCIDDAPIILTGGMPGGGSYSGPGVIDPVFTPSAAGAGTHTIVYSYTDGNGCSDTCNFLITVNPLPVVTCPESFSVCLNDDPFQIPTGSPEGGMFSGPGVVGGTTFDPSMAGVGEHTITYTYTDGNGCTNSCTFTITVLSLPVVNITVSPNDTVCAPQTITLNAGPGYQSYFWSTQETSQTIVVSVSGTYSVTVTDANGCSGNNSSTVVVNDPPEVTETHVDPSDCFSNDGSIDLTVTGTQPFSYNWASNTGTGLMNGMQDQTGLSVGTYRVTVTDDITGCATILSIVLSVEGGCGGCDPVEFVSVMPDTICSGDSATFTAEGILPGATLEWFDAEVGGNSVGTGNPFVSGPLTQTTTYCVEQTIIVANELMFELSGQQDTFIVPDGVTSITIGTYGAQGGDLNGGGGGLGGYSTGVLAVVPGQMLFLNVGGSGGAQVGGYNGGGSGGGSSTGGGGGASDVRTGTGLFTDRVIVGGGGGGAGESSTFIPGGSGGGLTGSDGTSGTTAIGGSGATQLMGGAGGSGGGSGADGAPGILGSGGSGAPGFNFFTSAGGGGGGYYGGGGGEAGEAGTTGSGGGGGSSYTGGVTGGTTTSGIQIGDGLVTLSFLGPCTSERTCATVFVIPTTPPVISCPADITIECATQIPPPNTADVTATDNLGGTPDVFFVNDVTVNQTCDNQFDVLRTYRAVDDCGNSASCTQTIEVNDDVPPTLTCPGNVTVQCAGNVPPAASNLPMSDNCTPAPTLSLASEVSVSNGCVNRFTLTRTYRATDACGNSATCTQTIVVNDNMPPTITCPANVTVQCAGNVPPPATNLPMSDNCTPAPTLSLAAEVTVSNGCVNRFTMTRTYRATDACGNTTDCVQTIVVNDNTAPLLTCPPPVMVQCSTLIPAPNTQLVTATDNCGGTPVISFVGDAVSGQTCFNRFVVTRTYRATDACNNSATCTQTITVFDNTPPTITCPAPVTVQCANLVPAVNLNLVTSDNCTGPAPVVSHVSDVTTNQTCFNRYTLTRTYRATDHCGNSSTCTQVITVFDNTPPTITCPANVTVQCAALVPPVNTGSVITADNCGGPAPVVTLVSNITTNQTCINRFTLTRTYRSTDACGNSATCAQIITVFDNTIPTYTFVHPLLVGAQNNSTIEVQCMGQDPNWEPPVFNAGSISAMDNCAGTVTVTYSEDLIDADNCPLYINRYRMRWIVTDACGNSTSANIFLNLVDTIPPEILNVPEDITVDCDAIPEVPANIMATDECQCACVILFEESELEPGCQNGQVLVRTWTAIDDCGNETVVSQNITLGDSKGPELIITQPEIAGLPDGTLLQYTCNEGGIPDFYDDLKDHSVFSPSTCGGDVTITFSSEEIITRSCEFFGFMEQRTFTWTGVDECGNTTTLTLTVELIDNEDPVIEGVPEMTCVGDPALDEIEVFDNCNNGHLRFWDVTIPNPCGTGNAIRRTYEAFDDCGNMVRDTAILLPNDGSAPTMEFINPVLKDLKPGEILIVDCDALFVPEDVAVDDDCLEGTTITLEENLLSTGNCATNGILEEWEFIWTATDMCGNSNSLSVIVHVVDQTPPVFANTNPEMTIGCNDPLPENFATDNCGNAVMTISDEVIPGDCIYEYDVHRTLTAVDGCGNVATLHQTIHVGDGSGPVISGVEEVVCDDLSEPDVTAWDPCAEEFVEVIMTQTELDIPCQDGIVMLRTFTATDACGNVSQVKQTFILDDNTAPEIQIPSHSIIHKYLDQLDNFAMLSDVETMSRLDDQEGGSISAFDDCGEEIDPLFDLEVTLADNCETDGYFERRVYSWSVSDACGNESTISFSVDIIDDVPPVLSGVPADETIICQDLPGVPDVIADDTAEPVDIDYTQEILPGSADGEFRVIREWIATDACGNSSAATQEITWIPDTFLDCGIVLPDAVDCNSFDVMIASFTSGGIPPLEYLWEVEGEKCFIQSGQGTEEIMIYIGFVPVDVSLTVTDEFGCSTVCTATLECIDPFDSGLNVIIGDPQGQTDPELTPGVNDGANHLQQIQLWPNPAKEMLQLSFTSSSVELIQYTFTNFLGQVVMKDKLTALKGFNKHSIDVSGIPEGSYLVQVKTENENHTKKVVIIRTN